MLLPHLLAAFVSPCPGREANGSSIPNIWGCGLLMVKTTEPALYRETQHQAQLRAGALEPDCLNANVGSAICFCVTLGKSLNLTSVKW